MLRLFGDRRLAKPERKFAARNTGSRPERRRHSERDEGRDGSDQCDPPDARLMAPIRPPIQQKNKRMRSINSRATRLQLRSMEESNNEKYAMVLLLGWNTAARLVRDGATSIAFFGALPSFEHPPDFDRRHQSGCGVCANPLGNHYESLSDSHRLDTWALEGGPARGCQAVHRIAARRRVLLLEQFQNRLQL